MAADQQTAGSSARTDARGAFADALASRSGSGAADLLQRRTVAPRVVLFVASIAVFMAFLDDTVVGIAFPDMLRSFPGATLAELSWVFNAYNIAFAAFLVPAGRLADLLGRRRLFVFGVATFTTFSLLCALAPSPGVLIAARAFQGVGAAALVPASMALVLVAHAPAKRAGAIGVWAATAALAAGIGPTVGGLLVYAYDWRLVFLINVPIGIAAVYLANRRLVESRARGRREMPDLLGALALAVTVAALATAVTEGPDRGWASPVVILALVAAIGCGVALARRCASHPAPVLEPAMLRAPGFAAISALTLLGSTGFLTLGLANVLFLMQVWHYSPLTTGLALTPAPFAAAPAAVLAGRWAERHDPRRLIAAGAALLAAGAAWLALRMGVEPDYLGAYLPGGLLVAIGIGLAFPLVSDAAVSYAPRGRFAGATSVNTAIRLVGGALGVAVLAALLGAAGQSAVVPYQRAWSFAGVCFAVLAVAGLRLPRFARSELDAGELDAAPESLAVIPRRERAPAREARPRAAAGRETVQELIAAVPIFATLPEESLRLVAKSTTTEYLPAGEWLFREGEAADSLYVLRSGRLEVTRESAGGELLIRELGPGSVVGELALLSGEERSASVRCRRDAELLRLSRPRFTELLDATPGFAAEVSRALAAQLQRSTAADVEPVARAMTVAVLAHGSPAAPGVEMLLLAELESLGGRVAQLDRATVTAAHPGAEPGVALARTLDRLEQDHELVVVSGTAGEADWVRACAEQADRVLLLIGDGEDELPVSLPRGRCDAVLLAPAEQPRVAALLDAVEPRSTHRLHNETLEPDVARLARRLAKRSVGLVLSGGGARAFAHLGVIEVLEEHGVVIDRVGGTSMGAYIGALLARGLGAEALDAHCYEEWVWRKPLSDYGLPRHALFRGRRVRTMLERTLPGTFEDLPLPYYCVAVDIVSNESVVQRRGDLPSAVAASMAVPGILPPVIRENRLLLDGAVLDGLPVSTMAEQQEGPIIACDVTERGLRRAGPDGRPQLPSLVSTLANMAFLTTADTVEQARLHADMVILPDHESVGALEFHMIDSLRLAGRQAALAALSQAPPGLLG